MKWNDQLIAKKIKEVVAFLEIDRMPSKSEVETYYGNSSLTNRIAKTGGFYGWAKKLGLEIKTSETSLGLKYEHWVKTLLEGKGFACCLTGMRHPYDILVNGRVKVDVKVANITKINGTNVYSFNLGKSMPTCDVYVAICLDTEKMPTKVYIVPASIMSGKKQLCIGFTDTTYDVFENQWSVISDLDLAYRMVEKLRENDHEVYTI